MNSYVVFTDLDGTLLDHDTYSFRRALPALDTLIRRDIAVVPVSSKTSAEIRRWMKLLCLSGPYVFENGGGVFIPEDYFASEVEGSVRDDSGIRVSIGDDIKVVRKALQRISTSTGIKAAGFGTMTADRIKALTGLKASELSACTMRGYDEPFVLDDDKDTATFYREAEKTGFTVTRGSRFHHLSSGCDKGRAVRLLTGLYRKSDPDIVTVGIGDSANDLPFLTEVDSAFQVMQPGGVYDDGIPENGIKRVPGIGPHGWRIAVEEVLSVVRD